MLFKIVSKIKNKLRPKEISSIQQYINKGNIVIGKGSDVSNLQIHIYGCEFGKIYITIGDDCLLQGSLTLYNNTAKVQIGNRVFIAHGTMINCFRNVRIDDDVMFSWGCTIMDTNAHSLISEERKYDVLNWKKGWEYKDWSNVKSQEILIGRKSWIGFNSIILKGVELKQGCVVAAGSVVSKSFDEYSVIGGNPAQLIKKTQ